MTRVLLVEDETGLRRAMRALLVHVGGFEVIEADDVASGLAALVADKPPDVVILDLMLPDGNLPSCMPHNKGGIGILRAIRDRELPVRVVVATAVIEGIVDELLRPLAPDAILYKPMDFEEVLAALAVKPDEKS